VSVQLTGYPPRTEKTGQARLQGGQFHDARIAAVCLENGVSVLWSADRDFSRFKALKTVNPLL
jgi:predicted nucleic acid-binding protein